MAYSHKTALASGVSYKWVPRLHTFLPCWPHIWGYSLLRFNNLLEWLIVLRKEIFLPLLVYYNQYSETVKWKTCIGPGVRNGVQSFQASSDCAALPAHWCVHLPRAHCVSLFKSFCWFHYIGMIDEVIVIECNVQFSSLPKWVEYSRTESSNPLSHYLCLVTRSCFEALREAPPWVTSWLKGSPFKRPLYHTGNFKGFRSSAKNWGQSTNMFLLCHR